MNQYRVRMVRDTSQSVDIIVTAKDEEEAVDKAYQKARSDWDLEWTDDDCASKPYCPDYNDDVEKLRDTKG